MLITQKRGHTHTLATDESLIRGKIDWFLLCIRISGPSMTLNHWMKSHDSMLSVTTLIDWRLHIIYRIDSDQQDEVDQIDKLKMCWIMVISLLLCCPYQISTFKNELLLNTKVKLRGTSLVRCMLFQLTGVVWDIRMFTSIFFSIRVDIKSTAVLNQIIFNPSMLLRQVWILSHQPNGRYSNKIDPTTSAFLVMKFLSLVSESTLATRISNSISAQRHFVLSFNLLHACFFFVLLRIIAVLSECTFVTSLPHVIMY